MHVHNNVQNYYSSIKDESILKKLNNCIINDTYISRDRAIF